MCVQTFAASSLAKIFVENRGGIKIFIPFSKSVSYPARFIIPSTPSSMSPVFQLAMAI